MLPTGMYRMRSFFLAMSHLSCVIVATLPPSAWGHAFGRIGVDHYLRVTPTPNVLRVEYDVHIGELPTSAISARLDANQNGTLDRDEMMGYVREALPAYVKRFKVTVAAGGQTNALSLQLPPGGVESNCVARIVETPERANTFRMHWTFQAAWPPWARTATDDLSVSVDRYTPRQPNGASWIFVVAASPPAPVDIVASEVPTDADIPLPPDITPTQTDISRIPVMRGACFVCRLRPPREESQHTVDPLQTVTTRVVSTGEGGPGTARSAVEDTPSRRTTEDRLRDRIMSLLRPPISHRTRMLLLMLSFVWGAAHAFTPGHGKAIAGAYLVGARASWRQAIALGIVVTIAHTAVVMVLAVAALILKDRFVYPQWLRPLGAVMILLVGTRQVVMGIARITGIHLHTHHHHHHDHAHSHGTDSPAQTRDVITVGISGGMVPCPASIVLILMAWQLGMPALGLACIISFSIGLALALCGVGLMAVLGTQLVLRWVSGSDTSHSHRLSFESIAPLVGGGVLLTLGILILRSG